MSKFLAYMAARLKEQSSWYGIVAFLAAGGVTMSPEKTQMIIGIGVAAAGVVAYVFPETKAPVKAK